jgi:hypothetical protein
MVKDPHVLRYILLRCLLVAHGCHPRIKRRSRPDGYSGRSIYNTTGAGGKQQRAVYQGFSQSCGHFQRSRQVDPSATQSHTIPHLGEPQRPQQTDAQLAGGYINVSLFSGDHGEYLHMLQHRNATKDARSIRNTVCAVPMKLTWCGNKIARYRSPACRVPHSALFCRVTAV